MAVEAIESRFYAGLIDGLEPDPSLVATQHDTTQFPAMHARFADIFATKTRDEWEATFASRDACVTPVLTMAQAIDFPHNVARESFVSANGQCRSLRRCASDARRPRSARPHPNPGQTTTTC